MILSALASLCLSAGFAQTAVSVPASAETEGGYRVVDSPDVFALQPDEIAAALQAPPAADSPLGTKILALTHSIYLSQAGGGEAPANLTVVTWNTADPDHASRLADTLQQLPRADVILVQEIGLRPAMELAQSLGMSVAWAPEFVQLNAPKTRDPRLGEALTGNAILSRFAIEEPHVLRFKDQTSWYQDEKRGRPLPEKVKAFGAKTAFGTDVPAHEVRLPPPFGGRMALAARTAGLTFVDLHLENKAQPSLRRRQMDEAIDFIADAGGPVMFGGDLNTSGRDDRILTVGRLVKQQFDNPMALGNTAATLGLDTAQYAANLSPYYGYGKTAFQAATWLKAKEDPTSIFNRDHKLFGDVKKELGAKPLDPRDKIGYQHTYATNRLDSIAGRTLDWLFLYDPSGKLSAADAVTHEKLVKDSGRGGQERVSDHFPISVRVLASN
jgi:endonuclease/exonuclease/phosphatase family metal-dependent hydrolase